MISTISVASSTIACGSTFGRMCLKITRAWESPPPRAACTQPTSRNDAVIDLITLA